MGHLDSDSICFHPVSHENPPDASQIFMKVCKLYSPTFCLPEGEWELENSPVSWQRGWGGVVLHKAGLAMDSGSSFIFLLGWKSWPQPLQQVFSGTFLNSLAKDISRGRECCWPSGARTTRVEKPQEHPLPLVPKGDLFIYSPQFISLSGSFPQPPGVGAAVSAGTGLSGWAEAFPGTL